MRRFILWVLLALLTPAFAFAAGFAKQSLFLSKTSVTEGETVIIHAVLSSETSFTGEVVFSDVRGTIGTVPVKLSAGEASAVSVSWKPAAGSQTITAELKNGAVSVEKESATFYITSKPVPVPAQPQPAAVESSQSIQNGIANVSPQAASAAAPLFTLLDAGREKAATIVEEQLAKTKNALGQDAGKVFGAEATKDAASNPGGTFWYILQTLYLYLLTVLGFIINTAGVFYPVFAVAVLWIIWKLFNRFRRPAY